MRVLLLPIEPFAPAPPKNETGEIPTHDQRPVLETLSRFGGRTSLFYVARALADARRVSRITIIADLPDHEGLGRELPDDPRFEFAQIERHAPIQSPDESAGFSREIAKFLEQIEPYLAEPVLIVTCETVLLRGQVVDDVIAHTKENSIEAGLCWCHPKHTRGVVPPRAQTENTATSPGKSFLSDPFEIIPLAFATSASLRGARSLLEQHGPLLEKLGSDRAGSFSVGFQLMGVAIRLLGWRFLHRAFKRRLRIADLEKAAMRILSCDCELIELAAPELCLRASDNSHREAIEKRLR